MIRILTLALLVAAPALADESPGGLLGREVTFGGLLYDTPDEPIYMGERHVATVGDGVEFGLGPEGAQNGFDIIPAYVDIFDNRVEISYPVGLDSEFPELGFNGYVLDFLTDCVLFRSAAVDTERNTGAITDEDVRVEGAKLFIDVGGAAYNPETIFAVTLDVIDCPLS